MCRCCRCYVSMHFNTHPSVFTEWSGDGGNWLFRVFYSPSLCSQVILFPLWYLNEMDFHNNRLCHDMNAADKVKSLFAYIFDFISLIKWGSLSLAWISRNQYEQFSLEIRRSTFGFVALNRFQFGRNDSHRSRNSYRNSKCCYCCCKLIIIIVWFVGKIDSISLF